MKKKKESSPERVDRKTVERNRRIHMKGLCFKLTSLVPPYHFKPSKDMLSQEAQLDQAATYIKNLRERIEELKRRKQLAMNTTATNGTNNNDNDLESPVTMSYKKPVVEIREMGSNLEVVLISGLKKNFTLHEVICILEDGGAEVVSTNISIIGEEVYHTLHAKVKILRVGVETSRLCQRLQELTT